MIYPSTTLHRVDPVTGNPVGYCRLDTESLVRDASEREILFDLKQPEPSLPKNGKTPV